ncbi:hypothetical protein D3C72_1345050 [compost metagenome]
MRSRSSRVLGKNSGIFRSNRPGRLRSMSSLSGRLVITSQRILPRCEVSAMKPLILANTRELVPESPSSPPRARSTSSITIMTEPMAFTMVRIFSRLPSVEPTHFSRKFLSARHVRPDSLAKASARKLLPVPIGPTSMMPIGTCLVRPSLIDCAASIRTSLTPSMPPTASNPWLLSISSTRPKHSCSMISLRLAAISSKVTGVADFLA